MTGIILEIYLKFVLERQNWKIVFAIPLKIYEINFSENFFLFFFLRIGKGNFKIMCKSWIIQTFWKQIDFGGIFNFYVR